ncbi:MAG: ABC-type transport system [Bacteroidota bacterium]|nr:ABC-type transport system [Bacteroidota bacterium]
MINMEKVKEKKETDEEKDVKDTDKGPVMEITHLSKGFDAKQILKDINLTLNKGENLVVLGKSGTGKSVLIKCIVRLLEPDKGKIKVFGKDMSALKDTELNDMRKKIGFLFQHAALYDSMSVRDNLKFPLRVSDKTDKEKEDLVVEMLESVGLADAIDKMPSELSGGMQKRIGLARTMILKPEIILYDEPTTGLDPVTCKEISNLILEVQKKYKTSSIIITHDMECARTTSNRMVVMKEGVVVAEGTYKELQKSEDEWVRSFFE